jgi:hypothetical protein
MNHLLLQGLCDAFGFVAGALLGMLIARWLGWDVFSAGYGAGSMLGIALCGIGAGLGVQGGRRILLPFLEQQFNIKKDEK